MKRTISILGAILLMFFSTLALAEPPIQMSPITRDLLKGSLIVGGAIGKALETLAPTCSQEQEKCWVSHGLNKDNLNQVYDLCWREAKSCSKSCKDTYFTRRKAGMSPAKADPLFKGGKGDSCELGTILAHP